MFDRMSMWLSTGLITAAVSVSLLVGAGAAVAATDPAGGGETSTSASAESAGSRTAPDTAGPETESDTAGPETGSDNSESDNSESDNSESDNSESDNSDDEDRHADKPAAEPEPTDDAGDEVEPADGVDDTAAAETPDRLDTPAEERHRDGATTPDDKKQAAEPVAEPAVDEPAPVAERAVDEPEPVAERAVDEPEPVADAINGSQPAAQPERIASESDVAAPEPAARAVEVAEPTGAQTRLAMVRGINDMFAGTAPTDDLLPESPYYGSPGELLQIDTPRGTAEAYVSPGPTERLTLLDRVFTFFSNIIFGIDFATCVAPSAENSTQKTELSLDGKAKPGQSIAQHVCTG
jgi:hypothetical protein